MSDATGETPPITGDQLLGEGTPITLLDGRVVHIKFSNRAMLKVEELFGSYYEMNEQLRQGTKGPLFTAVNKAIYCALQHDESWRGQWGTLVDSLDQDKVITDWHPAVVDALRLAFPPLAQESKEQPPTSTVEASPGPPSTLQLDDSLDLVMTSSGT